MMRDSDININYSCWVPVPTIFFHRIFFVVHTANHYFFIIFLFVFKRSYFHKISRVCIISSVSLIMVMGIASLPLFHLIVCVSLLGTHTYRIIMNIQLNMKTILLYNKFLFHNLLKEVSSSSHYLALLATLHTCIEDN